MEAQGGGEVRRLHIVYFLSRKGCIEHPHLIRVHHLSRNGVHLRDVKRWLLELRGKNVAESFAWSYKRRYKTGYVWQDLQDEDLITPISDNEYVLKGSEISSTTYNNDGQKEVPMQKESPHDQVKPKNPKPLSIEAIQEHPQTLMDVSTKASSEIEEESPPFSSETSTLSNDSLKLEEDKHSDATIVKQQHQQQQQQQNNRKGNFENTSFYSNFLNRNKNKKINGNNFNTAPSTSPASNSSSFTRSRSYSSGASNVFRNLITCGAVETMDSAMVTIDRRSQTSLSLPLSKPNSDKGGICNGEKLGGPQNISGNPRNQQQQQNGGGRKSWDGVKGSKKNKSEFSNRKTASAAYKPVNGPNCSQCGKQFKPEKLHAHMKSCKGMKASAAAAKKPHRSVHSPSRDSISAYYLTRK